MKITRGRMIVALIATALVFGAVARSQPAPDADQFVVKTDLLYKTAGDQELHFDYIRPRQVTVPVPVVLCIHGGGWAAGNKRDMWPTAIGLARLGYEGVAVEYRLAPKNPYPAQVDDVKDLVRYLRAHASELMIDPQRMGAIGNSAGGHLTLVLAETNLENEGGFTDSEHPSVLKAAVSMAGPTDLRHHFGSTADGILLNFFGKTYEQAPAIYREASPICHLSAACSPILMIHGDKDTLVPYDQATSMLSACRKSGIPVEL
ncbi:MAG TPA: alpha/beta hydrolase, partial [Chroococcales cyanobacterium]